MRILYSIGLALGSLAKGSYFYYGYFLEIALVTAVGLKLTFSFEIKSLYIGFKSNSNRNLKYLSRKFKSTEIWAREKYMPRMLA